MIERLIRELAEHNRREKEEDLYLEKLRTEAEGVGAIQYGEDTSHGTKSGDKLERGTIRLTEAQKMIAARREIRFELRADTSDFFYDRLNPYTARIMELYCIEGLSIRDISENIGRSYGYVNKQITEAKKSLK